ncbi:PACE efflux transporter [Psychrobacter sp. FBL11]|uniref:PACE efflux transporter n=1 Tax=Psychrobacter saeujeotis TaxID=3143436 RepID=A0ABU9X8R1_9GAMM|nr:PACE efflux transporter [uncultured Psychrobacter sp.]
MRTHRDRIRHAVGFEIIALILSIPIMSFFFDFNIKDISVIAITGSIIATLWNYGFNIAFDKGMVRFKRSTFKTPALRMLHVLLFESGLLMLYLPMVSWYLGITLWQAFIMDASLVGFYLVYTFSYNWAYDKIFPIPYFNYERNEAVSI